VQCCSELCLCADFRTVQSRRSAAFGALVRSAQLGIVPGSQVGPLPIHHCPLRGVSAIVEQDNDGIAAASEQRAEGRKWDGGGLARHDTTQMRRGLYLLINCYMAYAPDLLASHLEGPVPFKHQRAALRCGIVRTYCCRNGPTHGQVEDRSEVGVLHAW